MIHSGILHSWGGMGVWGLSSRFMMDCLACTGVVVGVDCNIFTAREGACAAIMSMRAHLSASRFSMSSSEGGGRGDGEVVGASSCAAFQNSISRYMGVDAMRCKC